MKSEKRLMIICNLMLLCAALIWGCNFVFQKNASEIIGPFTYMAVRYGVGATVMLPFVLFLEKQKPLEDRVKYDKSSVSTLLKIAAVMATVQMGSSVLGQWGIGFTNASKAAFLTATYIVIVPILSFIIFKKKTNLFTWIGVFIGLFGIYNLSVTGEFTMNTGDILVIISAAFGAMHLLLISKYVQKVNGMHLICVEFYFAAFYCIIIALFLEHPTLEILWACKVPLLYGSLLGTGLCYMLQVTAQKHTDPTVAALLMSLESLFGALAGVLILGESFSTQEIVGAVFLSAAIVIAQFKPRERIVVKVKYKTPSGRQ